MLGAPSIAGFCRMKYFNKSVVIVYEILII